jgi:hypothetical protein
MTFVRIKCKCSKLLRVPSSLAGKKVACPSCKRTYRLSPEQFGLAGQATGAQSATASVQQRVASAPAPAVVDSGSTILDPPPFNFDEELSSLSVLGISGIPGGNDDGDLKLADEPAFTPVFSREPSQPAEMQYASGKKKRSTARTFADNAGPKRGYWRDALYCFAYPFRNGGNIATFCIVAVFVLLKFPLEHVGPYGMIGRAFIFGWVSAVYLSVIQDTAGGSDDMPGIKMQDGILDDIVKPALKYVGSLAVALLPTAIYGIAYAMGGIPESLDHPLVPIFWLVAGIFLLPVILLLFSFNALTMVFRLDLIATTILRTFLPYLGLWAMLMVAGIVGVFVTHAPWLALVGIQGSGAFSIKSNIALRVFADVTDVYFTVAAMRMIGLYYLHFKHRFTIVME